MLCEFELSLVGCLAGVWYDIVLCPLNFFRSNFLFGVVFVFCFFDMLLNFTLFLSCPHVVCSVVCIM